METPQVVAALLEEREAIGKAIADLRRQVRKHTRPAPRLRDASDLCGDARSKNGTFRFVRLRHNTA